MKQLMCADARAMYCMGSIVSITITVYVVFVYVKGCVNFHEMPLLCCTPFLCFGMHLCIIILLKGNLPKPGNPYCGLTNNRPTDQLSAEELKYSCHSAQRCWRPTNNLLEVWQKLAIFGCRPFGAAVEALLMIVVYFQSSSSPIGFVFVAAAVSLA
jgi:hypothetical protein